MNAGSTPDGLRPFHELRLDTSRGVMLFISKRGWALPLREIQCGHAALEPQTFRWGLAQVPESGFFWMSSTSFDGGFSYLHVAIPCWIAFGATAICPSMFFARRKPMHPKGHCSSCGFDLTGNASGVCPECGRNVLV
jgi:hypothetical protein